MVKCLHCNGKLYRSYIRLNPTGKIARKWTGIGFYCIKCEINFSDKEVNKIRKDLIKINKNKQK